MGQAKARRGGRACACVRACAARRAAGRAAPAPRAPSPHQQFGYWSLARSSCAWLTSAKTSNMYGAAKDTHKAPPAIPEQSSALQQALRRRASC
eukprot:6187751-Pleurochrysis_carterae.AAC.4